MMTRELTIPDHPTRKPQASKKSGVEWATFVGIDGEGVNVNLDTCWICKLPKLGHTKEHPFVEEHRYVLLAAAKETYDIVGSVPDESLNTENLSTRDCLDFILDIPLSHKIFAYAFGYDLTNMLRDLDNKALYRLFRPELRQRKGPDAIKGPRPVRWECGQFVYYLNLQGTKFSVSRFERCVACLEADRQGIRKYMCDPCRGTRKRQVVWDIWKFYQCRFVGALKDWKVGAADVDNIESMKEQRSVLNTKTPKEVREYCLSECKHMGTLARKLTNAHEAAGLKLTSYYGAGSTGSAMLTVMGIRERLPMPVPPEMRAAVAAAFVGGRFEHSVAGIVREVVHGFDISNAYPYAITFLPCMGWRDPKTGKQTRACGRWELTNKRRDIDEARAVCVHYGLVPISHDDYWAPFPFREKDGSISFPRSSHGGWVWKSEYVAGEKAFPKNVRFREAWVWKSDCSCRRPFEVLPKYYRERIKIGKEGPGIVIKLGMNSCAGKLMQSIGSALFNSWIWGGMVTARTRAQILEVMALHEDRRNMLAVATDGVYTREAIFTPRPEDTDTWELPNEKGGIAKKPMGGWETKEKVTKGMFFLRPGIYFPLNPTENEIKEVRGRGVGKRMLLEHWEKIVDGWLDGSRMVKLPSLRRFHGAKSSISFGEKDGYKRSPLYGQWTERPVELLFDAMPKRMDFDPFGPVDLRPELMRLELRSIDTLRTIEGGESMPYDKSILSQEAIALKALKEIVEAGDDIDLYEADEVNEIGGV